MLPHVWQYGTEALWAALALRHPLTDESGLRVNARARPRALPQSSQRDDLASTPQSRHGLRNLCTTRSYPDRATRGATSVALSVGSTYWRQCAIERRLTPDGLRLPSFSLEPASNPRKCVCWRGSTRGLRGETYRGERGSYDRRRRVNAPLRDGVGEGERLYRSDEGNPPQTRANAPLRACERLALDRLARSRDGGDSLATPAVRLRGGCRSASNHT